MSAGLLDKNIAVALRCAQNDRKARRQAFMACLPRHKALATRLRTTGRGDRRRSGLQPEQRHQDSLTKPPGKRYLMNSDAVLQRIQTQAKAEKTRITRHAQQEMVEENITLDEVLAAIASGQIFVRRLGLHPEQDHRDSIPATSERIVLGEEEEVFNHFRY